MTNLLIALKYSLKTRLVISARDWMPKIETTIVIKLPPW